MHKRAIRLLLVVLILALGTITVDAEPALQQAQVQITSPEMNAQVRGVIAILGSASVPNFQFYKIEYGVGPNPSQWALIGTMRDAPVMNGQLEVWDTSKVPDGVYSLRLHAVKKDGNYEEFFVRQVSVVNSGPSPTASPTPEPTMSVTPTPDTMAPTPGAPAVDGTPKATATLQIIAPATSLSKVTPTPTLARSAQQQRGVLPIDYKGWWLSFRFGVLAAAAVFVLLGLVFGLRRLL